MALVVVASPLLRLVPVPLAATPTSNALLALIPLYSRMRKSGKLTLLLNVTVTVLAPAPAAAMPVA